MKLDHGVQLVEGRGRDEARDAAWIWARATALRDRLPEPATGEEKLPGIQRRLDLKGAALLLARRDSRHVGFTLFAPRGSSLEVYYLAVSPESWGTGVAGALLAGAEEHARAIGRAAVDLWVIADNDRALGVYHKAGYADTGQLQHDEPSGRTERRLLKLL